jgi:hypothetical protein
LHSSPQGALKNPRSFYDFDLSFRAAIEARITGRIPTPEEAASKDLLWLQSVNLQSEWIQFYQDQHKIKNGNGRS